MKHVLLVLPPEAEETKAVDFAVAEAAKRGESLVSIALLDADIAARVSTTLANVGFVGEKVCGNVADTLAREQRVHAEQALERVAAAAHAQNVAFHGRVEEGELDEVCGRIAVDCEIDLVVLATERRSLLGRFLARSAAVRLPSLAGCEVKLIEG